VRSKPAVKQGSEKTIRSAQEKKTLQTAADFVSVVQTTHQGEVGKTGVTGKLPAHPTMERQIEKKGDTTKIVNQVRCSYVYLHVVFQPCLILHVTLGS
jgi:hypothetical protein